MLVPADEGTYGIEEDRSQPKSKDYGSDVIAMIPERKYAERGKGCMAVSDRSRISHEGDSHQRSARLQPARGLKSSQFVASSFEVAISRQTRRRRVNPTVPLTMPV